MAAIKWPFVALGAGAIALGAWLASSRREVGAWSGWSAIADPDAAIARAKLAGVTRLAIFVNQEPELDAAWNTYDRAMILRAVDRIKGAGIKVTLVSWMMPNPDWIAGARELGELATACGVDELELDLEWEWTATLHDATDTRIATVTAELFRNLRSTFRGRLAVDCIVGVNLRVLGPAIAAADVVIPQAYATTKNAGSLAAGDLERRAVKRFAPFGKRIVLGVAGWNQDGAYKLGALDALRASLASAGELGVRSIRVWRLELLDASESAILAAWKDKAVA